MSDKQMKREGAEVSVIFAVLQEMLEQMKKDASTCNSLADGIKLERLMEEHNRMQAELEARFEKLFNVQMAKAKARGLVLH